MLVDESNFKTLNALSYSDLLASARAGVSQEKSAFITVLYHFREIERRRLYSDCKYSSLYKFAVDEYGYSEFEANSRVNAMHMLKELPALEEKIKSGALNLTNITYAQTLFRQEEIKSA